MKSDLERMRMEEIELKDQTKKQAEEVKEWESTIAEMETKKKARDDKVEMLQAQIAEIKAAVEKKRASMWIALRELGILLTGLQCARRKNNSSWNSRHGINLNSSSGRITSE
jgi:chromosome segregation ATPase